MSREMYEFRCPECDLTHTEAGRLATEQEEFCGLCAGDKGEDVRLIRWPAPQPEPSQPDSEESSDG